VERINRASTQRLYLVNRDDDVDVERSTSCSFAVLGSTGNLYTVVIEEVPSRNCPDFQRKRDLCKHILFVTLKVIGLSRDDPLSFQKAYVPSELSILFARLLSRSVGGSGDSSSGVLANTHVRESYARMKAGGEAAPPEEQGDNPESFAQRRHLEEGNSDCPICFDAMLPPQRAGEKLTYCRGTCGTNFHADCIRRWKSQQQQATCPACRQIWVDEDEDAKKVRASSGQGEEGYVNLGRLQGQSPVRDTSTYYSRRRYRPY
jgi:Zn-finger nucleic acid-binding protein